MTEIDYTTLSAEARLHIARDALRDAEGSFFRASLQSGDDATNAMRSDQLKREVVRLQEVVAALEAEVPPTEQRPRLPLAPAPPPATAKVEFADE